jgi:flagellar biosynthesis/type III secretory pathway M-ring protein FliF/YscJ
MAEKKSKTPATNLFEKQNLMLMLAGVVIIAIGMLLMVGGRSSDPAVFNEKEVYSFTRITIAPILIITGLVIEIIAIFKKPKS